MQISRARIASNWLSIAIGIMLAAAVAGGIVLMRRSLTVPKVIIGTKDQVVYTGASTRQEAMEAGQALQKAGFFSNSGATVLLVKKKHVTVLSFVLDSGAWDRAGAAAQYEELGRRLAPSIGGYPLQVQLLDTTGTVRKSLGVGKASIGVKDIIYYLGSASENDAKALGEALHTAGYLQDRGVTVVVSKDEVTSIGFVVGEGIWDRPDVVQIFVSLARQAAPSVGGLPIQVRFLNAATETKKEVSVQ